MGKAFASERCSLSGEGLGSYLLPFCGILIITFTANIFFVMTPGYFSHDELGILDRLSAGASIWDDGFTGITTAGFFRPLGMLLLMFGLHAPLQPFSAHALVVLLHALNCALLYLVVRRFRPEWAFAAALIFAVMPDAAFAVGWVAAIYDVSFVFFGLICINASVRFWRGEAMAWALVAMAALAAALLCKETAIIVPLAAAFIAYLDGTRISLRRLIALGVLFTLAGLGYAVLRLPYMLVIGASQNTGGYAFGTAPMIMANIAAYFDFPFAITAKEMSASGISDFAALKQTIAAHALTLGAHLAFVLLLWMRRGKTAPGIYLIAYYIPLLPVLFISKHEAQYLYASAIAMAVGLAALGAGRRPYAVLTAAITLALVSHTFVIQKNMYVTGACQTKALKSITSILPAISSNNNPVIYGPDDTPWWVVIRAIYGRTFHTGNGDINVIFSHRPEGATLKLSPDCGVTLTQQTGETGPHGH